MTVFLLLLLVEGGGMSVSAVVALLGTRKIAIDSVVERKGVNEQGMIMIACSSFRILVQDVHSASVKANGVCSTYRQY